VPVEYIAGKVVAKLIDCLAPDRRVEIEVKGIKDPLIGC
ncbi:hypothetical protein O5833_26990, partial [Escherichia coli]|nr:hypothetical protein [Escherichia coli]